MRIDELQKGGRTIGGDLQKNYQDLKEGISTTVDGLINETFGPIGGMVSSLTTGFFKRRKENKENLEQTEIQSRSSEELLESFGVQNEKLDIIAENTGEKKDGEDTDAEDVKDTDAEEKGGEVSDDKGSTGFLKTAEDKIQKITNIFISQTDSIFNVKEKDILTV